MSGNGGFGIWPDPSINIKPSPGQGSHSTVAQPTACKWTERRQLGAGLPTQGKNIQKVSVMCTGLFFSFLFLLKIMTHYS